VTSDCHVCGTTIIQSDGFAEAAAKHYKPDREANFYERVELALLNCGAECGGFGTFTLCAYHADRVDKD